MRPFALNTLFFCLLPLYVFGASWGDDLFTVKKHNFGIVALGSEAVERFEMENVFFQDIRILGVYSSCGCTSPSVTTKLLKSGEKGAVIAKLNTDGQYLRDRAATLTVDLETTVNGQILRETVQLSVTGYVRPDVVLTPGSVEFGSVSHGKAATRNIELHYAGRNHWALMKIDRQNPFIYARADEIKRYSGEVTYQISVTLKEDTPVGYIKDLLRFSTNEVKPGTGEPIEIVLPVQGVVTAPLHITPSPFMVGVLSPGDSAAKNIVIRNEMPFKILSVDSPDKRFRFAFPEQESSVQLLSVLFSAKNMQAQTPLPISGTIRIQTNLPEQKFITVDTQTLIVPETF